MLEPTQRRLNRSGPERSLSNGAGLGSERRTLLRGPRTLAGASPGTGGQFPVLGGLLRTGADHATSGPHPIATSRLGTHRERRRVRCSPSESDPDESEGSARLAVSRPRITGTSWARGAATASSREELLPWFGGTAIPAALVTRSTWAGSPTTTASREHLLSKGRTGHQSKKCQGARQTSSNDALHRC